MSNPKMFRIMGPLGSRSWEPFYVPWALMAPHEKMAQKNHAQSLQKLHSRGGLDPVEAIAVIKGIEWGKGVAEKLDVHACITELKQMADQAQRTGAKK